MSEYNQITKGARAAARNNHARPIEVPHGTARTTPFPREAFIRLPTTLPKARTLPLDLKQTEFHGTDSPYSEFPETQPQLLTIGRFPANLSKMEKNCHLVEISLVHG